MINTVTDQRIPIKVGDIICPDGDQEYEVAPAKTGCDGCDYHCGLKGAKQYDCSPDDDSDQSFPEMILVKINSDEPDEMSWLEFYQMKFR